MWRSGYYKKTQLVVRRRGMSPPSSLIHREAGQRGQVANALATNHVHFDVQNPIFILMQLFVELLKCYE